MKITMLKLVFEGLMPVQQQKIKDLCGPEFPNLLEQGRIIIFGLVYTKDEINAINQMTPANKVDKKRWDIYAHAYLRFNRELNSIVSALSPKVHGIPIFATLEGMAKTMKHVSEYYPLTISHRIIAEHAGMGWRSKNGLVIHPQYSCAIRFASIITAVPFLIDSKLDNGCGECTACLGACSFLKNQNELEEYRENCRKFILGLDLDADVCGKCIKACLESPRFQDVF
jgi:epoxyqueuosine reductase QueG